MSDSVTGNHNEWKTRIILFGLIWLFVFIIIYILQKCINAEVFNYYWKFVIF